MTLDTRPTLTVFRRSPDRGLGLSRDMRVRWALEEVGVPYDVRTVTFEELKQPAHRARNPFGQIPALEADGLVLFESGAIVFHIAERHPRLLPVDPAARARAIAWIFAALSTVEPPILDLQNAKFAEAKESWAAARLPLVEARIDARLAELAARLGDSEWLDGAFSAGDLVMVHVLQRLKPSGVLARHPVLAAYVARAEARPAYARAFAAQHALNTAPDDASP